MNDFVLPLRDHFCAAVAFPPVFEPVFFRRLLKKRGSKVMQSLFSELLYIKPCFREDLPHTFSATVFFVGVLLELRRETDCPFCRLLDVRILVQLPDRFLVD